MPDESDNPSWHLVLILNLALPTYVCFILYIYLVYNILSCCNFIVLKGNESSEEELQRIRDNLLDLDGSLGAYPYESLKQWNRLTCNISGIYTACLTLCVYIYFITISTYNSFYHYCHL